ncbi:hypothetical protein CKO51_26075 [Rhodopirellula sp. SM50]|nr:hypothetical protein CKO51_26075 [Rhodopirellula sp. SM50]
MPRRREDNSHHLLRRRYKADADLQERSAHSDRKRPRARQHAVADERPVPPAISAACNQCRLQSVPPAISAGSYQRDWGEAFDGCGRGFSGDGRRKATRGGSHQQPLSEIQLSRPGPWRSPGPLEREGSPAGSPTFPVWPREPSREAADDVDGQMPLGPTTNVSFSP